MTRKSVQSSVIKEYRYDKSEQSLEILFINGKVYKYVDVPQNIFDEFEKAKSKGTYYNENIKHSYIFID